MLNINKYSKSFLFLFIVLCSQEFSLALASNSIIEDLEENESRTKVLTSLQDHRKILKEALEKASERVVIVSPYISDYALKSDNLTEIIQQTQERSVQVTIYTDKKLDKEFNKSTLKLNAKSGRDCLRENEVDFRIIDKVHSKVLIKDDDLIVIGSFNWLSALRNSNNQYCNHEQSIAVMGCEANSLIENSLVGLEKVKEIKTPYSKAFRKTEIDKDDAINIAETISSQLYDSLSFDDQWAFSEDLEQLAEDYDPSEEGNNISENKKEGMKYYHKKGKSRILKNARQLKGNDGSGSESDSE